MFYKPMAIRNGMSRIVVNFRRMQNTTADDTNNNNTNKQLTLFCSVKNSKSNENV